MSCRASYRQASGQPEVQTGAIGEARVGVRVMVRVRAMWAWGYVGPGAAAMHPEAMCGAPAG